MAEEIINIATLTIDRTEANKSIVETKQAIFELQKANTELRKDISKNGDVTGEQTKQFVANEQQLKKLNAEYKTQSAAINDLTLAELKTNKALTETAKSRDAAIAQTKELKAIRGQLNTSTVEGAQALELLNKKIDANDNYLKSNASAQEKAAAITGNYRQYMFGLGESFDKANTVIQGFKSVTSAAGEGVTKATNSIVGFSNASKKQAEELQKVTNISGGAAKANTGLSETLKGATGGSDGLGKSFMAIGKIGIIAVITLIVAIFQKLYQTFAPIKDAVDGLIAGFKSLGDSIMSVVKFLSMGDFNKAGESLSSMGDNATKAANATMGLNRAVRELDASVAKLSVTNAVHAGKERELQIAFEDSTKSMDSRTKAMAGVVAQQKEQLKGTADIARQDLGIEQRKLGILLNGRKLTKQLLADDLEVAEQFNTLQKKKATLYTTEQEVRLFNLQKSKKISDANVQIADDEFKIVTGSIKKQVELLDTKLQKEGITSKEIRSIVSQEQALKMQALGEYDRLFKKVSGNKIGAGDLFDEKGFVRIGINMFDMAKKFQLSATQADRLRDMLGEYKDIDDRLLKGKKQESDVIKAEQASRIALAKKTLDNTKIVFETEKHTAEEKLVFYTKYYEKLNKLQGSGDEVKNARELSGTLLEIAQSTIAEEIEAQNKKFEEKKKLTEQEKNDEVANATFLRETQIKRTNEALLNEVDKAAALEEIQKGYIANIDLIEKTYEQSKKDRAEIAKQDAKILADVAAELSILALQEQGATEAEIQKENLRIQHEQTLEALRLDLEAKKKAGEDESALTALKVLEDKKYAAATKKINDQIAAAKRATNVGMVKDSLAAASAIFGENKAVAVAMALVNTYEGISAGVKLGYPAAIPAVAAAAATGFAAVKNILKTDKSGGGGGGSSSGGSTTATPAATFENVARTQTVATVNAPPVQDIQQSSQPVLILETLSEAQKNQIIKINSK